MTPSLADAASSAECLSKLTASGDHTKPVSSDLARARTSVIATAAATAKATLDDSVKRAYVKLPYKGVSRISVLPLLTYWNKTDGAQALTRSIKICNVRHPHALQRPLYRGCTISDVGARLRSPLHMAFTRTITKKKQEEKRKKNGTPPIFFKTHPHSTVQVPTTQLVKMNIDPKFVELTADVLQTCL